MNLVEKTLIENINNSNSLFVFPTDISASGWADRLLRLQEGTIAMNKFIAWDDFKQNSIKSKVQNKRSIPSVLRKIFVSSLVNENAQNAAQGKTPIFSSLIKAEWAQAAAQFTPWLTGVLPQLGVWFKKVTGLTADSILGNEAENAASKMEGDDKDLFVLIRRYALFLSEHNLFEPAWETPPFNDEGKEVFIFFPESLSDYGEYRELLADSRHVKTIRASNTDDLKSDTFFYPNSRSEIKEAALYIRALNENHGVNWDSIAVCVPNSENYEPYVLREFTNRNIPFVKRSSKLLCDYPAGGFFRSILECVSQNFPFSALVSLIMNKALPWKNSLPIEKLVQFGIDNNCLYSWVEEIDGEEKYINVWEDAFNNPIRFYDRETRELFNELRKRLNSFRRCESFNEIRRQYFIFREYFFDMETCGEESDLILSRCISELMNLVEIEKSFPDVKAPDPFLFFTEYLDEVPYLPQQELSGVAILPYKTAAAAPFDCHIILGAGQESLSVVYSRLDFLPRKKREELGILDEDASLSFINMHKYNSKKVSAFFCSEQTFSGFAIPHSKIDSPSEPRTRYSTDAAFADKFAQDYFDAESAFYSSLAITNDEKLHESQINGFTNWKNRRSKKSTSSGKWTAGEKIKDIIKTQYAKTGKYSVSATSLQKYYQCSFKWLFENVFAIENSRIETSLMAENLSGLVYHAILNNFFTELKNGSPLLVPEQTDLGLSLPPSYRTLLEKSINKIFDCFPLLKTDGHPQMSALTARLLRAGKDDVNYHLEKCLSSFLSFFAGYKVAGSECNYKYENDTYILNGFIDCILKENRDGIDKYVIVDFKLKYMPARCDCTADEETPLTDFQLPMYITLIEKNEHFEVYTALFYSILDQKPQVIIGTVHDKSANKNIPSKEEDQIIRSSERYMKIFSEFKNRTEQFTEEISSGNFTVFPQDNNDCFNCDYQRLCRTVYIIGRENKNTLGKH
ncbi:PD-(D/E)XK nuclease family protein [Treponema sp. R80B11-R83G3]